jgi:hypothetical protein
VTDTRGSGRGAAGLTAPEFAVLLADNRPQLSSVLRAALVETVARGVLRLEPLRVKAMIGSREERLLVAGPDLSAALPAALGPARSAFERAPQTRTVEGRPGVRVEQWVALLRIEGVGGYLDGVVRSALVDRGLLVRVSRRFWPGTRLVLTDDGAATAASARAAVEQARATVVPPARGWEADPRAAAAAVAALGTLGILALADRDLVAVLVEARRIANVDNSSMPVGSGDDVYGDPMHRYHVDLHDPTGQDLGGGDLHGLDAGGLGGLDGLGHLDGLGGLGGLDGLDLGGLDAVDSGVSGSDGGGSDGGGGGDGGGS